MLCDIWRVGNPDSRQYSWYKYHPNSNFSRLDFFLVNVGLTSFFTSCKYLPGFRTDHSFIEMELEINPIERGRGFWKFNVSHLNKPGYDFKIRDVITKSLADTTDLKPDAIWENLKCKIIGASIDFAVHKAKENKENLNILFDKLNLIQASMNNSALDGMECDTIDELRRNYIEIESYIS